MQSEVHSFLTLSFLTLTFKLLPLLGTLYLVTVFQLIAFALLYSLVFSNSADASDTTGFLMIFFGFVYLIPGLMDFKPM